MTVRIAIGIGCRRGCPAAPIEALVHRALATTPDAEPQGLFTIRDKSGEKGLIEAAARLELDLFFLPREALREQQAFVQTHSAWSATLFGVPSVAEAAALAGAGANAVLLVPRMAADGATCAIAGAPA